MSHHVAVRLPDGRDAVADYRQPVTTVMHRVLTRIMADSANRTGKGVNCAADLADKALIAEWLDHYADQACTWPQVTAGTCTHPPASPEPFTPPPYKRPVTGGLW